MKKVYLLLFTVLYWAVFPPITVMFAQEEGTVKSLDPQMEIMNKNLLTAIPEHVRSYFVRPSSDITTRIASGSKKVDEANVSSIKWIQTVLQSRWIPKDLDERLVALNEDIYDSDPNKPDSFTQFDAVRVRYEMGGYYIQITQTSFAITIIVKPTVLKEPISVSHEAQVKSVTYMIHSFLNMPDKITACSMNKVTSISGITHGKPDFTKLPDASNFWYGLVSWWTDGESFAFVCGKADGRVTLPPVIRDWF